MERAPQRFPWHTQATGIVARKLSENMLVELTFGRFTEKVIKAVKGEKGIVEPTYIYLPGVPGGDAIAKETGVDYFSVPVELGVWTPKALSSLVDLLTGISHSPPALRKPRIHSQMSTTMRRSFLKLAPRVSRATLRRALNSLRTLRQSKQFPSRLQFCNTTLSITQLLHIL